MEAMDIKDFPKAQKGPAPWPSSGKKKTAESSNENAAEKVEERSATENLFDGHVTKKCTRCGEDKHRSTFSPDKYSKDGLRSWCKTCAAEDTFKRSKKKLAVKRVFHEVPEEVRLPSKPVGPPDWKPVYPPIMPTIVIEIAGHRVSLCKECLRRYLGVL